MVLSVSISRFDKRGPWNCLIHLQDCVESEQQTWAQKNRSSFSLSHWNFLGIWLINLILDPISPVAKSLDSPSNTNYRTETEMSRKEARILLALETLGTQALEDEDVTCGYVYISLFPWHPQELLCKALIWKRLKKTCQNVLFPWSVTHNQYTFKHTHLYLALTLHFTVIYEIFAVLHLKIFSNLTSFCNK